MVSPLSPSSGACSEGQRCPLRSCHLQGNCLGDGTVGTKPDSEDDWKWVEYSFDFRKQAGSSTKCSWAKWLLIISNSTLLLWALTGRSWFSMGCVGCVDVCAGEWAWHALLVPRLPLKHWNEWWESIAWGHSSCVQHWRLSFTFSFCPSLSLVSADLGLLQISGQLLSMVGISLKDEGLCSGANTLSQEHIVQGNKPWYSGCNFSCISTCLWRGSRWLCQVVPSDGALLSHGWLQRQRWIFTSPLLAFDVVIAGSVTCSGEDGTDCCGIHLGLHEPVLSAAACLTALLEIVCSFVIKNPLKMPCLFLQGSLWVSSTFFLLHLDDWGCCKVIPNSLLWPLFAGTF